MARDIQTVVTSFSKINSNTILSTTLKPVQTDILKQIQTEEGLPQISCQYCDLY